MDLCWLNESFTWNILKKGFHLLKTFLIHICFYKVCWHCRQQRIPLAVARYICGGMLECAIYSHNCERDVDASNSIQ
jgi:hypothetical protein